MLKNVIKGTKVLDYTDVTYGIIRIKEGDVAKHLPTLFKPITIVDDRGNKYAKRMHLSVENRIDGLTKLYREHNVKIGDVVDMEFEGATLKMSFKHQNIISPMSTDKHHEKQSELIDVIGLVKDKIEKLEYLFYDNEMNVRVEIVEPILNKLGWSSPELAREQKGRNGRRVDIALYNNNDCMALLEVKAIDENLSNEKLKDQLMSYLDDERFKKVQFGILTNGRIWLAYNRNGNLLQAIDICRFDEKRIEEFFLQFSYNRISEAKISEQDTSNFFDHRQTKNIVIREKDGYIQESNTTATFKKFIERHLDDIYKLQEENRFSIIILAEKSSDVRNSSAVKYGTKTLYITGDHSTFFKRMLIKQIINELEIDATVEEIKED